MACAGTARDVTYQGGCPTCGLGGNEPAGTSSMLVLSFYVRRSGSCTRTHRHGCGLSVKTGWQTSCQRQLAARCRSTSCGTGPRSWLRRGSAVSRRTVGRFVAQVMPRNESRGDLSVACFRTDQRGGWMDVMYLHADGSLLQTMTHTLEEGRRQVAPGETDWQRAEMR